MGGKIYDIKDKVLAVLSTGRLTFEIHKASHWEVANRLPEQMVELVCCWLLAIFSRNQRLAPSRILEVILSLMLDAQ